MSPVDRLGTFLARIRGQAVGPKKSAPPSTATSTEPAVGDATRAASRRTALVAAIARIPPDAPNRSRWAFRLYLQAVIADEFAIEDVNGSGFQALLDRVLLAMEGEPKLAETMARAGEGLLAKAGAK